MDTIRRHVWIVGPTRSARRAAMAGPPSPHLVVGCHQRLRGPYTGTGAVLRAYVPDAFRRWPELVEAHRVELLYTIPELSADIGPEPETLVGSTPYEERTRYFGLQWIRGMSQGVISLLLEYGRRLSAQWLDGGPLRLAFDDVDAAESTEQELLALLVRRADPASLHVVIGSAADRLPRLLCLLGRIEQERGALDEARAALDRALLADPACAPALVDRATLAYSREDPSAAAADLTAALELLGDDPDVLYNRGVVYQEWGRFSDAVVDFDRAMTDAGADTAELLSRRAECLAALVGPAGGRVGVA